MHTWKQLSAQSFSVQIDDIASDLGGLFPEWTRNDRFGIVVNEPFGLVGGANLMLQAAITRYYDMRRDTHSAVPTYPEVYIFHVGGTYGNHGFYDLTPARKEVVVGTDPWELIVAIAEHGITRLAVPDGEPSEFDYVNTPGGWYYGTALLDHLTSSFAYSPDGEVEGHDVVMHTDDDNLLYNRRAVLDMEAAIASMPPPTPEGLKQVNLGYTSLGDLEHLGHQAEARKDEVSAEKRHELMERFADATTEQYRRLDNEEALRLLKSSCEAVSGEFSGARPEFPYRDWAPELAHR